MIEEDDLILDFEESDQPLDIATKGQRFANYIIDQIATSILGGLLLVPVIFNLGIAEDDSGFRFLSYFVGFIIGLIYYSLLEFLTGKSIGKMITKTKVVTESGDKPTFLNILGRTLCRFIPFEPLSFLFGDDDKGWHDTISKTMVVADV